MVHPADARFSAEIHVVEAKAGRALKPAFAILFHLPPAGNTETARALARLSKLTRAEREVARLVAAGYANAETATALRVSPSTVRTHLRHIFEKLGITTRLRLAPLYQVLEQQRCAGFSQGERLAAKGKRRPAGFARRAARAGRGG